jgi:hypothetical protein
VFILLCGLLLILCPNTLCRLLQNGFRRLEKVSATLDPEKLRNGLRLSLKKNLCENWENGWSGVFER